MLYHHHHHRHGRFLLFPLLFVVLLSLRNAAGEEVRIANENDFFTFLDNVNRGVNYNETTIYLDSDLSLPNIVDSIGNQKTSRHLIGTFDGQGHVISNLVLNSSSTQCTGLFGYSEGMSIRNIVLDSSCSITNSYRESEYIYVGGIVGYCCPVNGPCIIENTINMASVTFDGDTRESYIYMGGVVGNFYSSSLPLDFYLKNCVNYGPVTHSGISYESRIGGVSGLSYFSTEYYNFIYNYLNYGTITHNGTTTNRLHLGGITSRTRYAYVENCLSVGKISLVTKGGSNLFGSIVGHIESNSTFDNCYYTEDLNEFEKYGFIDDMDTLYESNTPNTSTSENEAVNNLNSQVSSSNGWNRWVLNMNNKVITIKMNNNEGFSLSPNVIILPDLISDWRSFAGWFTDNTFTTQFSSSSVSDDITLYGRWDKYVLKFDYGNGTIHEDFLNYNEPIVYPESITREGYDLDGWDTKIEFMPAYDLTITAKWKEASSSSLINIIIGAVVIVFFIIVIIIVVVLIVHLRKKDDFERSSNRTDFGRSNVPANKNYSRAAEMTKDDTANNATTTTAAHTDQDVKSVISNLYPENYERPTMKDALLAAGLSEKQIEMVCDNCRDAARKTMEEYAALPEGFTEDDAMAIAMYTHDFGAKELEYNPYRIINKSLAGGGHNHLERAKGLLYLVMTALRKLPRVTGITLYRGVRSKVNLDNSHYSEGNIITWLALSSTSPDMSATKRFLAKGSKKGKSEGTLFSIEGGWGYNIQPYSLFPNEEEILLEPERQFKVKSIIQADGLTFINLQMLDTPLSLPEVFGKGRD